MKITKSFSDDFDDKEVEKQPGERIHISLEEIVEFAHEKYIPFLKKCNGIIMSEDGITFLIKKI
jgi:hypothetical protein